MRGSIILFTEDCRSWRGTTATHHDHSRRADALVRATRRGRLSVALLAVALVRSSAAHQRDLTPGSPADRRVD